MNVDKLYDSVADEYEDLINSPKVNAKLVYNLEKIFKKYNIVSGSILDLGCGPGNLATSLGNSFVYTGIDVSERMLSKAKEKGYEVIRGKIEQELKKIPDKSFDYIVSLSAIYFVEDIALTLSELDRISIKGWIISLADITESYAKYSSVHAPLYNHTKLKINDLNEDVTFMAWTSPYSGEEIKERLIFKKF
jgi:ubiquinone/menaquinone biosynthesis C-methylase UbiE